MDGMTTQERIEDISRISGLSDDIVRRVLDAERLSVAASLKRGERASLIGRAVIRPEIRKKVVIGGKFCGAEDPELESHIKLIFTPAAALEALLEDTSQFVEDKAEDKEDGVQLRFIDALS